MTWLDDLALGSVIVHIRNAGPSLRANVEAVYDDGVLLRDVVNLDEDAQVVEAGTQFVPRENVERVQLLEGS
jgi:hypothetical protein